MSVLSAVTVKSPQWTVSTGIVAIANSATASAPSELQSVTVHFSAAPVAAGSLTITLDAVDGATYDTLLYSGSMIGVTDLLYVPDSALPLKTGDIIAVAYANADGRTYGCRIGLVVV